MTELFQLVKDRILIPPHPLTNFEIQKYHQNEWRFNCVYSRNNLPKIKHGAYVINLDENESIGTHCVSHCKSSHDVMYFYCFKVEHISKEIKNFIWNKIIITNNYRIQAHDSIMCWYFCIRLTDFMLKGNFLITNAKRMIK